MHPHTVTRARTQVSTTPCKAIVFFTSENRTHFVLGLVASTAVTTPEDGTDFTFVQPRPIILLTPPRSEDEIKNGGAVKGRLVDISDPCVANLSTAPLSSAPLEHHHRYAPPSLTGAGTNAAITDEELQEMREHRDGLKADMETSKARLREIDGLLQKNVREESSDARAVSTPSPPRGASPLRVHPNAGRNTVDRAERAASAAEKKLLLARSGLRTVKPQAWIELQRRRRSSSSQSLISLIETAAVPMHDSACALFEDVVAQATSLPKRLMSVKSTAVTVEDTKRLLRFFKVCPAVDVVREEHRAAAPLYRWVDGLLKASQAQRQLKTVQRTLVTTRPQGSASGRRSKTTKSPDPTPMSSIHCGRVAVEELQKEREDQMEYVQMAEEELAAVDALISEAEALASSSLHGAHDPLSSTKATTLALMVPTSWVMCTLPDEESERIVPYAEHPCHDEVLLSNGSSQFLLRVMLAPAATAAAASSTPRGPPSPVVCPGKKIRGPSESDKNRSTSFDNADVSQLTRGSQNTPRSASTSSASVRNRALASTATPPSGGRSGEDTEEKIRLLEARLSAALQHNPREAEVQLLRDELTAKRTELHRVMEERDRLLQDRYEKSFYYVSSVRCATSNTALGGGGGACSSGPGINLGQSSTPRETVDRSVVEELEHQLTAAHQRISELLIETSRSRRGLPSLTDSTKAPIADQSSNNDADMQGSPSPSFARQKPSTEDVEKASLPSDAIRRHPSPKLMSELSAQHAPETVTREMYADLEARLRGVSAELETRKQQAQRLEEQLNDVLHRCSEAEHTVSAQKQELKEVWERLEVAEALAEEQSLLARQHLILDQTHLSSRPQQQEQRHSLFALLPPTSSSEDSNFTKINASTPVPSSTEVSEEHPMRGKHGRLLNGRPSGILDATTTVQPSKDAIKTTTNIGMYHTTASGQTTDSSTHNPKTVLPPDSVNGCAAVTATSASGVADYLSLNPYSVSSSILQSRPVEQLSMIELRHEVHHLREEVERHHSGELRLAMEVQTLREKQKAEHKRRRDACQARMQMLARMQSDITDAIDTSTRDLQDIPLVLERSRLEAKALMEKHRK